MTTIHAFNVLIEKGDTIVERAADGDKALYQDAVKLFEEATRLSEEHRGKLDETTLVSRERLADSLRGAGNLAKAIDCHRENVERTLKNLRKYQDSSGFKAGLISAAQEQHLYAQRQLAETYLANKDYDKAISTYQAVVDTKIRKSREDACKDRANLASALFTSGSDRNIMKAVDLNIETLIRAEASLGKDHPESIEIRYNLGKELYDLEKYGDALEKFREVVEILQLEDCKARSMPGYQEHLKEAEASLKNCKTKIARQQEKARQRIASEAGERRRAEEELKIQAAEQKRAQEASARQEEEARQVKLRLREAEEKKRKQREDAKKSAREREIRIQHEEEAKKRRALLEKVERREQEESARRAAAEEATKIQIEEARRIRVREEREEKRKQKELAKQAAEKLQIRKEEEEAKRKMEVLELEKKKRNDENQKSEHSSRRPSDIRNNASSPIDSSRRTISRSDKRTSDDTTTSLSKVESVSNRPRTKDTSKGSSAQSSKTEPPTHRRAASVVSQSSDLTGSKLRELDRINTTSDLLRSKDMSGRSLATKSKTEPPTRPRSASSTIHGSSRTEDRPEKSERRNSSRSEVMDRSQSATPDKGRRPPSTVSRYSDRTGKKAIELERVSSMRSNEARTTSLDRVERGKAETKKAQAPSKPESAVVIQDPKREQGGEKAKAVLENSMTARKTTSDGSARASSRSSADAESRDSDSSKTHVGCSKRHSGKRPPNPEPDEKQDSGLKVTSNRAPSGDKGASRTVPAPSITVTEPAAPRKTATKKRDQEPPIVDEKAQVKTGGDRPRSSQSNYKVDSSIPDTARKREPRSGSTSSGRAPQSLEASKGPGDASAQIRRSEDSASDAAVSEKSKTKSQTRQKVERPSDSWAPSLNTGAAGPSGSMKKSLPLYEELSNPAREIQEATLLLGSSGDTVRAPPKSDSAQLRETMEEERRNDDIMSVSTAGLDKQPQSTGLPEPSSIVRTDTSVTGAVEWTIPGAWPRDTDEPDASKKLRRVRSNEEIKLGGLQESPTHGESHRRTSSVNLPQHSVPARSETPIRDNRSAAEVGVDEWFENLRENAHVFLDKYTDDSYKETKAERRVRIAILDSGVAKKKSANGEVPGLLRGPNLKRGTELDPSLPWNTDTKGHGTHAAGLILDICPYANVYMYRVCQGNEPIEQQHVADAIMDAVDKKKVDIISMSLGWQLDNHKALGAAIRHARAKEVLLFAASSNEGIWVKNGMAYPARAMEVIAVDSANAMGGPSTFNPRGINGRSRFTVPGEGIRSTWPMDLPTDDPEPGFKRLTGTSCATPIAAGIAGLLLEFARQRPMCFDTRIEGWLKRVEDMRLVLEKLLSEPSGTDSRGNMYRVIDPTKLFYCTPEFSEGGDWAESRSPRLKAAYSIADILDQEHGGRIGSLISAKVDEEVARRRHQRA